MVDPVLNLAMAEPDPFEQAEERRLFYVALTRARRGVVLVAPADSPSPFVTELVAAGLVQDEGLAGTRPDIDIPTVCPSCSRGVLRPRTGPYGAFLGCSTFPACNYTSHETARTPLWSEMLLDA